MSEQRSAVYGTVALVALAIAASVPRAGAAQSAAQSAAQYRARLVSALRDRRTAQDSLDTLRARRGVDLPPDSLTSGLIRVRYAKANLGPSVEATLRGAVLHASAVADAQFGDARFDGTQAAIIVNRVQRGMIGSLTFDVLQIELPGPTGRLSTIRSPVTQRKLADELLDMTGTIATQGVPESVTKWAGYWAPSRPLTADDWQGAALDLATSSSSVTRTCYSGSETGCESALGLTPVHDRLTEWYTPDGWRALVDTWDPPVGDPALVAAHADCVKKNVIETCKRLALSRQVPIPLNMSTRSTLFNLAIARGGRSAYTRLRGATGTPLEVLARVAGVAPAVLVDDWRAHVLAALPRSALPSAGETTALVAWTVLFGFAATRRRPWR
jgi:hypothetical protein